MDATGRARVLPNLLELPSRRGGRTDTALFAHVDKTYLEKEGYVHTTRLDHGWSWRIPLPDRVSLGMVIGTEFLPQIRRDEGGALRQFAAAGFHAAHGGRRTRNA